MTTPDNPDSPTRDAQLIRDHLVAENDSSLVCEHGVPESLGDCEMCKWDRELANAQATDDDEIWYTDE